MVGEDLLFFLEILLHFAELVVVPVQLLDLLEQGLGLGGLAGSQLGFQVADLLLELLDFAGLLVRSFEVQC